MFVPVLLVALAGLAAEPAPQPPPAPARVDAPAPPHVLVLADGRRLPLLEAPRWAFGRASVSDALGRRFVLAWAEVDHEATRRANPPVDKPDDKVWTNRDLEDLRGERLNVLGGVPEPSSTGGGARPATPAPVLANPQAGTEAQWSGRATPLREQIQGLEAQLAALERARDSWEAFTLGTGGDYEAAAASELGKIRRAREAAETRLRSARADWAALEEEARKAGALPGWLR